jgi:hypothetical protein
VREKYCTMADKFKRPTRLAEIWLLLTLILICYKRKTLFAGLKIYQCKIGPYILSFLYFCSQSQLVVCLAFSPFPSIKLVVKYAQPFLLSRQSQSDFRDSQACSLFFSEHGHCFFRENCFLPYSFCSLFFCRHNL